MAITLDVQFYCFLFFTWLASTLLVRSLAKKSLKSKRVFQYPPSPRSLPIIGHLHLLSSVLPKSFQTLALRHGPLMRLSLGKSTAIVVSNSTTAKEFLKTHEMNFVSRPAFGASDFDIYKDSKFVNAEYGAYWRFMKKVCMTELLAGTTLIRFTDIRKEEMVKLLDILSRCSEDGRDCDVGREIMTMTNNVICRMAMSTRCSRNADEGKEIWGLVKGILDVAPKFSLGEMLGPLVKYDLFGYGRELRSLMMKFDRMVEGIMMEHEKEREIGGEKESKDMMDILLEIHVDENSEVKLSRDDIKSFLMEMFMAGTETISVAMQWTLAEIVNHPDVFKKVREEINEVVGSNRLVQESDVPNLPYLQAVVKESLRLHAPAPLIFRKCKEDCKINGYDITSNERIIFNVYAIMRDPEAWGNDAHAFVPDRFLASSMDDGDQQQMVGFMGGREYSFLPFGSGRRGCPGASLASVVMHAAIGALVQCFDFKVKGGEKLDLIEGPGLSSGMAHPLLCYPITHVNPLKLTTVSG